MTSGTNALTRGSAAAVSQVVQPRFEPPAADVLGHLGRVLAHEPQTDVRVPRAEVGDEPGEEEAGGGAEHADAQSAAGELAHLRDRFARVRQRRQHPLGLGPEGTARFGEDDAAADAREQRDAELRLERAHLLREGRLGEVELAGGPAERAVLGRGEEVGELLQSHRLSLWELKITQTSPSARSYLP